MKLKDMQSIFIFQYPKVSILWGPGYGERGGVFHEPYERRRARWSALASGVLPLPKEGYISRHVPRMCARLVINEDLIRIES